MIHFHSGWCGENCAKVRVESGESQQILGLQDQISQGEGLLDLNCTHEHNILKFLFVFYVSGEMKPPMQDA